MHFNPVESSRQGFLRRGCETDDDLSDFIGFQGAWFRDIGKSTIDKGLSFGPDRGRRHGGPPARLQRRMRDAANVPQLKKNPSAAGVDGMGY
jgi:hypothetical protein